VQADQTLSASRITGIDSGSPYTVLSTSCRTSSRRPASNPGVLGCPCVERGRPLRQTVPQQWRGLRHAHQPVLDHPDQPDLLGQLDQARQTWQFGTALGANTWSPIRGSILSPVSSSATNARASPSLTLPVVVSERSSTMPVSALPDR
jgi:hypothetical protein